MSSDLQRIIEVLPHLDHNELMQIHVRVGSLLKNSIGAGSSHKSSKYTEPNNIDSMMLVEVICDVLSARGLDIHAGMLRKTADFGRMKTSKLSKYLDRSGFNHTEMRFFMKIGVKLMVSDLEEIGVPVGGVTLMRHIHRIPLVIERAFPGYADSGALYMLVRRNTSNGAPDAKVQNR